MRALDKSPKNARRTRNGERGGNVLGKGRGDFIARATGGSEGSAREALRESENRFRLMADALPALISYVDADERYQFNNAAYENWFGGPRELYLKRTVRSVVGREAYSRLEPEIKAALAGSARSFQMQIPYKGAGLRDVEVDYVPHRNVAGHVAGFFALIRDISERKRLEAEILKVTESEQRRIAQDLHDGVSQALSGAKHFASTLARNLAGKGRDHKDAERVVELLSECAEEIRRVARGLYPVKEEPYALMFALEELAARTTDLFSLKCRFVCRRPVAVADHAVATHLYRIAQESISNAIRHGKARQIQVKLSSSRRGLTLEIADNGRAKKRPGEGMGIPIMRYRAGAIGGMLAIRKRRSHGTSVICTVKPGMKGAKRRRNNAKHADSRTAE